MNIINDLKSVFKYVKNDLAKCEFKLVSVGESVMVVAGAGFMCNIMSVNGLQIINISVDGFSLYGEHNAKHSTISENSINIARRLDHLILKHKQKTVDENIARLEKELEEQRKLKNTSL